MVVFRHTLMAFVGLTYSIALQDFIVIVHTQQSLTSLIRLPHGNFWCSPWPLSSKIPHYNVCM